MGRSGGGRGRKFARRRKEYREIGERSARRDKQQPPPELDIDAYRAPESRPEFHASEYDSEDIDGQS